MNKKRFYEVYERRIKELLDSPNVFIATKSKNDEVTLCNSSKELPEEFVKSYCVFIKPLTFVFAYTSKPFRRQNNASELFNKLLSRNKLSEDEKLKILFYTPVIKNFLFSNSVQRDKKFQIEYIT